MTMGGFFFTLNDSAFFEEQLFDTTPSAENYVKLYFWVTMRWNPISYCLETIHAKLT